MERAIGIDLGTTNSVISVFQGNEPEIITNSRGSRITPSVVAFTKEGEILVGQAAKNQAIINSSRTFSSIKRKMGSDFSCLVDGKKYRAEEISAQILRKLKKDAEEFLGCEVNQAVITVPAYFNDSQRQATVNAGKIAGIEVLRIVNEPTAAALAYGLDSREEQIVMVFDIGGGTYDVSILEIGNGVFQVLATSGNNHLGGDDFDQKLADYIIEQYQETEGIDLKKDRMALQRLMEEVEKVKIELSEMPVVDLNIPFVTATEEGPKHLEMQITRSIFENLIKDVVDSIEEPAKVALRDSKLEIDQVDKVLLVGGSTRIPIIQNKIHEITGKEPSKNINPDECVALGASIQAAIVKGDTKGVILVDVIPLTLGIEVEGGSMVPIIERNTAIPVSKTKLFTTIADNQQVVEVKIFQGERKLAIANKFLGNFQLKGIRNAVKGDPRIEVSFDVNVDGILNVSARDLDTGVVQEIEIKEASGLSDDEIHKLIDDAKEYEKHDQEYFAKMTLINKAEGLIIKANDLLCFFKENGLESKYEEMIADTKDALDELDKHKQRENPVVRDIQDMVESVEALINSLADAKNLEKKDLKGDEKKSDDDEDLTTESSKEITEEDLEILEGD